MTITHHMDLIQGSDEWHAIRCGLLTASEMHLVVTPTLQIANNDKVRTHLWELMAQRITQYVEPSYISDDMLRGRVDEIKARAAYSETHAPVTEAGFITNDKWGFLIGYSPDGLVDDDPEGEGQIECKSRRQKAQIEFLTVHVPAKTIPTENIIQVQTGLLVSGRKWCDYVSRCGGLPQGKVRAYPDKAARDAIIKGAAGFEESLAERMKIYEGVLASNLDLIPTEREIEQEMFV